MAKETLKNKEVIVQCRPHGTFFKCGMLHLGWRSAFATAGSFADGASEPSTGACQKGQNESSHHWPCNRLL
eukprot:SAG11_NODE_13649_length_645_cov_1.216117_2_plen_70_part_01